MNTTTIDPYKNSDKELEFIGIAFFPEFNLSVSSQCFFYFPQFEKDFQALWQDKIITADKNKFKWNYSLTSLAQYFYSLDKVWDGYFWGMIELEFGIKRHTLKHLASKNGNVFYREKSIDYEKLMTLLETHRKQVEEQEKEANKNFYITRYNEIKDFVLIKKIPSNMAELEEFAKELITKARYLTALF